MTTHSFVRTAAVALLVVFATHARAQAPEAARVTEIAGWMEPGTYSPTPTVENRDFWTRVGNSDSYRTVGANAEKFLDKTFQPLPDELYLEYSKTGNRTRYERVYFEKLKAFRTLVVAEGVENQGRFLPSIQALIASYAADKSWVLPAHDGGLKNFEGREITIDLFASEVACELATADFILGDRLDPQTRSLVRQEAQRRIFAPYSMMVTTGKPGMQWLTVTNNWNAVCLANVTGTALALHNEPQDKAFYVAAAEKYIANFLKGFTDDGYCSEGIGYWNYGYGCFVRLGHMLDGATGGKVDLFAPPKARSAGLFARRMEITPGVYPAFADCSVGSTPSREIMAYVTRRYDLPPTEWEQGGASTARWLDELGVFSFQFQESTDPQPAEVPSNRDWFEDAGILICRGAKTDTGLPVGVALKGGHNEEHHNHNDVGSYVFCIADSMTLVDPGAEVYTRRTFSADRYVSNVLNSFGHPVPRVADQLQKTGRSAAARVLNLDLTDDQDTLQFDLTSAYPVETLKQLTRTFVYQRTAASLTVTDEVEFTSPETFGTALITFSTWKQLAADRLLVGTGATAVEIQIDAAGRPVTIEATTLQDDVRGGERPTRIGIDLAEPVSNAVIRLIIRASAKPAS
ncbi:MAG: heparinase II/III domain-containing protein [Pirellulaceae bacterium]